MKDRVPLAYGVSIRLTYCDILYFGDLIVETSRRSGRPGLSIFTVL